MKYPALFFLMLLPSLVHSADENIYLMTKVKVRNTTYTQAMFLSDKLIDSMEECEKERRWGIEGRWRFLGHKVKRVAGYSVQVNYFCVKTPGKFSRWSSSDEYLDVYLIQYEGETVTLKKASSYSNCMTEMRKTQMKESNKLFCARINQEFDI